MLTPADRLTAVTMLHDAKAILWRTASVLTEAANPTLKNTILRQFNDWVYVHDLVFQLLDREGVYPAHHVERLIRENIRWAEAALHPPEA
ncbi:spore coat protein [Hydrogenibacillus schlegelii]|uniref:Spore coat protein n=1 Tax=Hydrogenibacillus schlegelii TaxID=1484 RepID=A0A132MQD3_HYDSH|nr:spore coat protein [Hydrogenibacillus schlegelii]KWX00004.1 hypothetical protein TR75_08965 [Hydrogenibacillus schlegelii]MBT9283613.1 spore coat protein [Hydrogenibacillus schlegelii]OAR05082.1 hypothetical protein SA87_06140 [Hydrogenibacillus schlegelii]PTQ52960.1 MAG: hypothetical protein HSCHL_2459 [Hydrogenibacillus schlegelii]